jgi:DNA polymerase III, delta subunit
MNLVDKYRPRVITDILGQPWLVHQLGLYIEQPYPVAFLFAGNTGTGKTSAALCLARSLGVAMDDEEFGGLHQIASGEQTGETVRMKINAMRVRPFTGSGWKVLIVNEADHMTANAAQIWLDALESIPPQTVIVFTTNSAGKLPARLRDRCEGFQFESGLLSLQPAMRELAARVWAAEVGGDCPDLEAFGPLIDDRGDVSFRRLLQQMTPFIRSGQRPSCVKRIDTTKATRNGRAAALKAWETRRKNAMAEA